jgi:hypothetical protein
VVVEEEVNEMVHLIHQAEDKAVVEMAELILTLETVFPQVIQEMLDKQVDQAQQIRVAAEEQVLKHQVVHL